MSDEQQILVTGAAGGTGRAIVPRLRADGYNVIASDRIGAPQGDAAARWISADLRSKEDRAALVEAAGSRLCGLVHAAGIILSQAIPTITDEDFDTSFDVNFKAGFFLARDCLPLFEPGAAIVMVGLVAGQRASPENLVYAASKAALRSVAGSLAVAFTQRDVRVNVVAPGLSATDRTEKSTDELSVIRSAARDDVWKARVQGIPQGRPGAPDEVAQAVAWLLSPQSAYVTGATIAVNGGLLAGG